MGGVDDASGMDSVATLAKQWIDDCLESHQTCNVVRGTAVQIPRQAPTLPTRVVDVGSEGATSPLRLFIPDISGHNAEYITLSYCWGNQGHNARTTKANLEEMQQEIKWSYLPKCNFVRLKTRP